MADDEGIGAFLPKIGYESPNSLCRPQIPQAARCDSYSLAAQIHFRQLGELRMCFLLNIRDDVSRKTL